MLKGRYYNTETVSLSPITGLRNNRYDRSTTMYTRLKHPIAAYMLNSKLQLRFPGSVQVVSYNIYYVT